MATPRHDQDGGARGRELEMIHELAQIVSWRPARPDLTGQAQAAGDEAAGAERQDEREGSSRRR